jgi:hypothetical protein
MNENAHSYRNSTYNKIKSLYRIEPHEIKDKHQEDNYYKRSALSGKYTGRFSYVYDFQH